MNLHDKVLRHRRPVDVELAEEVGGDADDKGDG